MDNQHHGKYGYFDAVSLPLMGQSHDRAMDSLQIPYVEPLESYMGYRLSDLKNAKLMDRVDTKFLISIQQLPLLLRELQPHYSSLEINGRRLFTYHNTYFDTPDHRFYYLHHQGKLGRYKVRHRYYVDTQLGFLEVKLKNNKGRTIKSRIPQVKPCLDSQEVTSFLASKLNLNFQDLQPTQWGSYQRISLANETSGERLTLDLNLNFQSVDNRASVHLPNVFIAELKQNRRSIDSPFVKLMAKLGIRPKKFSKYCIGCSMLTPGLKANRFKPQLMALQKFH